VEGEHMFTILLWDQMNSITLSKINNRHGNEMFLMQSDTDRFPLLSDLADCAEDIFSGNNLQKLIKELDVVATMLDSQENIDYIRGIIFMINQAIATNKSILFTPFFS
jgi:hypothetical protein